MKSASAWLIGLIVVTKLAVAQQLNIGAMVKPVPADAVFSDPGYFVWCGSMVKGPDNKFHLFYSRWPQKLGFAAWVTNSEVAHAVADNANGPYQFVNVVLPPRDKKYWDGGATHNPTILISHGKYYLYYMGTTGRGNVTYPASTKDSVWWEYRNKQRIGVAVANRPEGAWQRADAPVLNIDKKPGALDGLMTSNPAVTFGKGGKIVMVYKEVEYNHTMRGGKVRFGVAFSNKPLGPFKKEVNPVFQVTSPGKEWMVAEDPYIWYAHGRYFAIVRDVVGKFTGQAGALAMLTSKNGKEWAAANNPKVLGSTFKWADGTDSGTQLERPQLYFEHGFPKLLFGALAIKTGQVKIGSVNVRVPLAAN